MCLKQSIKKTLIMINKGISQMPLDKKNNMANRVNKVIEKYDGQ